MPVPKTEESILLRVLVQVLVAVGIVATDIAAGTQMSFWAVPLSFAGGVWGWYRRRDRNITAKFLIALGMLLALALFLGNLLANIDDTRLILAELLVQLQVLHSFDLPRRKDLGYSTVIGLILLGVAATLSETLAFAPVLIVFFIVALPILILDYRSRLELAEILPTRPRRNRKSPRPKSPSKFWKYSPLSPQRLGVFALIALALGLALFAIMPRFPGYQQFTFPVSGAAELENATFNSENRGIFNPGVRSGNTGEEEGNNGEGDGDGEGVGQDDTYYGFQSKIDQSSQEDGGALEPKVVLRVRSQAPGFWRVLGFDRYTGRGWEISRNDKLIQVERIPWSYRFFLSPPYGVARKKEVIQTYTVVEPLPNLLPALAQAKVLYFPTQEVAIDPEGSIRSPASLRKELTYTVISDVPFRDRTLLREAPTDYSESITKYYLQVPPAIEGKVRQKAEELLAKSPKPITSAYEKALFLAQALKQNYEIQEQFSGLKADDDLVEAFLFRYQGGYPDHFSTVLTIMLRSLGIPARLAAGFGTGQFNPFTGFYLVRNTDAFAVTEVFFPEYGWFAFDPVPGRDLVPISFEEPQTFSVLRQFWNWVASWLPSPVAGFFSTLWQGTVSAIASAFGWFWRLLSSGWVGAMTGSILAVGAGFLGWVAWSNWRTWRDRLRLAKLPPMERTYRQMANLLAAKGYAKHPAQTPLEYAQLSRQHYQASAVEIVEEISHAYIRWRYGGQPQNVKHLQQKLQVLRKQLGVFRTRSTQSIGSGGKL